MRPAPGRPPSAADHDWELVEAVPFFDMVGDGRPGHGLLGVSDPDVHHNDGRWSMLFGAMTTRFTVGIFEALLPEEALITDDRWRIVCDHRGRAIPLGPPARSTWDRFGMHTPSRVTGFADGQAADRIYYAGQLTRRGDGARSRYAIGCLQRAADGRWERLDRPVLQGDHHRPSALEPFVIWEQGCWRMWYLACVGEVGRGEQPDYEMRYTESDDGIKWERSERFSTPAEGFFDNTVIASGGGWRMLLARGTNLHGTTPYPSQGLWLLETPKTPGGRTEWSEPARILDTDGHADRWYAAGVCGPAAVINDTGKIMHVFATGTYARVPWLRTALQRMRRRRRPPVPSPFHLATGRFTFRRTS